MFFIILFSGDYSEDVTPVPISNTEVKGLSGDCTAALSCGRVARCRDFFQKRLKRKLEPLFVSHKASSYVETIDKYAVKP